MQLARRLTIDLLGVRQTVSVDHIPMQSKPNKHHCIDPADHSEHFSIKLAVGNRKSVDKANEKGNPDILCVEYVERFASIMSSPIPAA